MVSEEQQANQIYAILKILLCNLHCLKSRLGLLGNKISTAQQPEPRHDSLSYVTFLFRNGVS